MEILLKTYVRINIFEIFLYLATKENPTGSTFMVFPPRRYSLAVFCLLPKHPKYMPTSVEMIIIVAKTR